MTELCSNAIEHGLLKLDTSLKINADGFARYYQAVPDSGDGFNVTKPILPLADNITLSGRGLALVQQLGTQLSIIKG